MTTQKEDTMSQPTTPTPAARPRRVVFWHIIATTLYLGAWIWAIVLVVTLGVPFAVDFFGGHTGSIYSGASQAPRWFLFVLAIIVVAEGLGPNIALGVTRRAFVSQHVAGFAVVAAVFGVVSLAMTFVERWFYERLGWPLETFYGQHPVATDPWPLVYVDHALLLAVYAVAGLAVGAVYYRWRGWIGTLALPLTVGPVLLAATVLPHVDATDTAEVLRLDGLPYVAGLAIAVAAAAWLWATAHVALRGAAVRQRTNTSS